MRGTSNGINPPILTPLKKQAIPPKKADAGLLELPVPGGAPRSGRSLLNIAQLPCCRLILMDSCDAVRLQENAPWRSNSGTITEENDMYNPGIGHFLEGIGRYTGYIMFR